MDRILIIEDDVNINNLISEALEKAGYESTQAFSGTEGLMCADRESYSLAILDLMLPGLPGEEVLPRLKEKQEIPVIILSAKDGVDNKINLLNYGAEDYMTKPFDIRELIARIGIQIRRMARTAENDSATLTFKSLVLRQNSLYATLDGKELKLTRLEFKILELLLSNQNRVFSKQDIYDYVWSECYMGEDKTVNVHISNIRKKIKEFTDEEYIETVWGIGFRLAK